MKKNAVVLSATLLISALVRAGEFDQFAIRALGDIASYSHKAGYSQSVSDVYLGYDAEGKIVSAAVIGPVRTYAPVNGVVAVSGKEGCWTVREASIPDIARIKDPAKLQKATAAIKEFSGSTVKAADGSLKPVDAVTGATRYQESIYTGFNLLARTAVEAAEGNPDWPKTPVSK
jgi:hypothetical protein